MAFIFFVCKSWFLRTQCQHDLSSSVCLALHLSLSMAAKNLTNKRIKAMIRVLIEKFIDNQIFRNSLSLW